MVKIGMASSWVIQMLEDVFLRWGKFVCLHPYVVILTSILITSLSSVGFLWFRLESKANMLWIPAESDYNVNQDWLDKNFQKSTRTEVLLIEADNVLTKPILQKMLDLFISINAIEVDGKHFNDICAKIPVADIFQTRRRRRRQADLEIEADASSSLSIGKDIEVNFVNNTISQEFLRGEGKVNNVKEYDIDNISEYEENDNEDEDFWAYEEEIYDNYDQEPAKVTRINFEKYAREKVKEFEMPDLPDQIYCDLVTTLNTKCFVSSLLEIWRFDQNLISTTSEQEILDSINQLNFSPWNGHPIDFSKMLGGITTNSSGHIVSAKSSLMVLQVEVDTDNLVISSAATGVELELADPITLTWEEELVQVALNASDSTIKVMINAARSFGDVSGQAIFFDATLMGAGYLLMFVYTCLMLGRVNMIEVRVWLAVSGILSVCMGLVIGVGISSLLRYPFTPTHAILPFLCLGIGIDDMFVIVQCWTNLSRNPSFRSLSIPEKMAMTMKHAGVTVTVTSITDVFVFGIGAFTKMPGLESFCVCTAIAIGSIYLLQVSWFVAWMSLDEVRKSSSRDSLLPCIQHKENNSAQINSGLAIWETMNKTVDKLLSSHLFKVLVIISTVVMLVFGIWGSLLIRRKFDPTLLLPSDSYLREMLGRHDLLYPDNGWTAEVYTAQLDHNSLHSLDKVVTELENLQQSDQYLGEVNSWWTKMKEFALEKNFSSWEEFANPIDFQMVLSDFLYSPHGGIFQNNFEFAGELGCNRPAPPVLASKFSLTYKIMTGPEDHIPARHQVEKLVSPLPGAFSHVQVYAAWETDEIIGLELWRNIGLAAIVVFIVTLILLANIPVCLMVLLTVSFTLVDLVGFLHFWDMTIDIISCINIVLAIGLCVDYSVHIGHSFLVAQGSKKERAVQTVITIGPAVLNGGLTTFLALVLLAASTSHVFLTFFKVFLLTVVFGLFHGLILFPVLLTMLGPRNKSPDISSSSSVTTTTIESEEDLQKQTMSSNQTS